MFFKLALAELSLYRCDQLFACDMVSRVATFVSTKDREDQLCTRVPSSSGYGIPGPQENLRSRLNTPTGLSAWSFGKYIHSLPHITVLEKDEGFECYPVGKAVPNHPILCFIK